MFDCGESSYKYAARRSHVLGITPHRTVKTLHLGIRHRRIGDDSRSESGVCTYPRGVADPFRPQRRPGIAPPHVDSRTSPDVRSCSGVCSFPITSRYLVWGCPALQDPLQCSAQRQLTVAWRMHCIIVIVASRIGSGIRSRSSCADFMCLHVTVARSVALAMPRGLSS